MMRNAAVGGELGRVVKHDDVATRRGEVYREGAVSAVTADRLWLNEAHAARSDASVSPVRLQVAKGEGPDK